MNEKDELFETIAQLIKTQEKQIKLNTDFIIFMFLLTVFNLLVLLVVMIVK